MGASWVTWPLEDEDKTLAIKSLISKTKEADVMWFLPTFSEPALCTRQKHNQLEPELPQSNKAPSALEWPVT